METKYYSVQQKKTGYSYMIIGPFSEEDGGLFCVLVRNPDGVLVDALYGETSKTNAKSSAEKSIVNLLSGTVNDA